jgi:hypothetical protein
MASPGQSSLFTTFTELVTTTYRNHKKEVADAVSNHNALFRKLSAKGRIRMEDGGLSIVAPIDYAENSTYQRYSGFDVLNIAASDVLSAAEFPWRQVAVNVAASGLEIRTNSGENRIINFVKAKIKNAQRTMANGLSEDIYSAGTASNQIGGLQHIIADGSGSVQYGVGTVGGINASTFAFWRNQVFDASVGSVTPSATTIENSMMLPLWLACTRGMDTPDLIVMDSVYFSYFENSQTSLKRYASSDSAQAGIVSLKYKTADVVYDSSDSGMPASHAYFVNTDFLELVAHQDAWMEIMPELKSVNQDGIVVPILTQANMTCSNRARLGVMHA